MRDNEAVVTLVIGFLIGSFLWLGVFVFHDSMPRKRFQQEAVEAGVAKYKCDEKTGVTEFIWIKPEGENK